MQLILSFISLFLLLINALIIYLIVNAFGPSYSAYDGLYVFFLVPLLLVTTALNYGVHCSIKKVEPDMSEIGTHEGATPASNDIPDFGKIIRNWFKKIL